MDHIIKKYKPKANLSVKDYFIDPKLKMTEAERSDEVDCGLE